MCVVFKYMCILKSASWTQRCSNCYKRFTLCSFYEHLVCLLFLNLKLHFLNPNQKMTLQKRYSPDLKSENKYFKLQPLEQCLHQQCKTLVTGSCMVSNPLTLHCDHFDCGSDHSYSWASCLTTIDSDVILWWWTANEYKNGICFKSKLLNTNPELML